MTASNHAATGALIGLIITQPLIAVPLALLSHFVCDAIPHFGMKDDSVGSRRFRNLLIGDAGLCILLVFVLILLQPLNWLLAAICAIVATSPDLMWLNKFRLAQAGKPATEPSSGLLRFHAGIQWFEKPVGLVVEAVWAVTAVILLKLFII